MYTAALVLADGARLGVRPLEPGDRDAFAASFARLSPESRRRRFLGPKPRLSARELKYLTEIDNVTHAALVAVDDGRIVGEARYATAGGRADTADFAITVDDEWQGRGLGTRLAASLVAVARRNGIARLTATTLAENAPARALLRRLGFRVVGHDGAELALALSL
jgi:RimJ/RimL family protein N-acetyltransferase